ncbi:hypothetical protein BGZ76_009323 [Entomortierella beljakovae]|nr:hypothetical protein BGZ76_009323 [Entomortierella beljakovae]
MGVPRYRNLVRNISIRLADLKYYNAIYPNLYSLQIDVDAGLDLSITRMISQNTSVTKLHLDGHLVSRIWTVISGLSSLRELSIHNIVLKNNGEIQSFHQACANLECIDITILACMGDQELFGTMGFQKMRTLSIRYIKGVDSHALLNVYRRIPRLKELKWISQVDNSFLECFEKRAWPELKVLSLSDCLSDESLEFILSHSAPLERLLLSNGHLKPEAIGSLKPHFDTLVELQLLSWADESFAHPDVLSHTPNLQEFSCGKMKAKDIVSSGPWVCQHLHVMHISIRFQHDEQNLQPLVLERISQLRHLRSLYFHSRKQLLFQKTMDLRLECGLGKLDTLTHLRVLRFDHTTQRMNVAEVEWICRNWRNVQTIRGVLNDDLRVYTALSAAIRGCNLNRLIKVQWRDKFLG